LRATPSDLGVTSAMRGGQIIAPRGLGLRLPAARSLPARELALAALRDANARQRKDEATN
jgi:hypothetical protein